MYWPRFLRFLLVSRSYNALSLSPSLPSRASLSISLHYLRRIGGSFASLVTQASGVDGVHMCIYVYIYRVCFAFHTPIVSLSGPHRRPTDPSSTSSFFFFFFSPSSPLFPFFFFRNRCACMSRPLLPLLLLLLLLPWLLSLPWTTREGGEERAYERYRP